MDHLCELKLDPRDPDQIIRDLRDRIEELEPALADWKGMAMKYRAERGRFREALEMIAKNKAIHGQDAYLIATEALKG